MITLKIDTAYGVLEITGTTSAELNQQVAQLEGAGDLMTAVGRLKAMNNTSDAMVNTGSVLGGSVVEETHKTDNVSVGSNTESTEPITTNAPLICGQPAKEWSGQDSQGDHRTAWIDPRDNITPSMIVVSDPDDPRLVTREARFWQYTN